MLRPATFIKKETLAQAFFCKFCKVFKNTFFTEHLHTSAPDLCLWRLENILWLDADYWRKNARLNKTYEVIKKFLGWRDFVTGTIQYVTRNGSNFIY